MSCYSTCSETVSLEDQLLDFGNENHVSQLCRLCAKPSANVNRIFLYSDDHDQFLKKNVELDLAEIITLALPIKVSQKDTLPKQVCKPCLGKLLSCHQFILSCVAAEQKLKNACGETKFKLAHLNIIIVNISMARGDAPNPSNQLVHLQQGGSRGIVQSKHSPAEDLKLKLHCPLCYEGTMELVSNPLQTLDDGKWEIVTPSALDSETDDCYLQANEILVASDSDHEPLFERFEDDVMREQPVKNSATDEIDVVDDGEVMFDDYSDVDYHIRRRFGLSTKVGRRGAGGGAQFHSDPARGDSRSDDTLLCVTVDEESPDFILVQCLLCSQWLPGLSACLNHALQTHMDSRNKINEEIGYLRCPRCPFNDLQNRGQLVEHFNSAHIERDGNNRYSTLRYSCAFCGCAHECDVCGALFQSDQTLSEHLKDNHVEDMLLCGNCGEKFHTGKELALHFLQHCKNIPCYSPEHMRFPQKGENLRENLCLVSKDVLHNSDDCGLVFNRYNWYKNHVATHFFAESMEYWECLRCGAALPAEHPAQSHSAKLAHILQTVYLNKVYRCEFCDLDFSSIVSLNIHRSIHDDINKPYVCSFCSKGFDTFSLCIAHKVSHENLSSQSGCYGIPKHFVCNNCAFCFLIRSFPEVSTPIWSHLQIHRKMRHSDHGDKRGCTCTLCPEKFNRLLELNQHRSEVHGAEIVSQKKSLKCPLCGQMFSYLHSLDAHMELKHAPADLAIQVERYQCELCGKVFKYQSSFITHQKMHQVEKGFTCQLCSKGFISKETLRVHIKRSHQGVKSHHCDYCGKGFYHLVSRNEHMRIHTGEKPFKCSYCGSCFQLRSMLTDHVRIHNDDRPYHCDICGSSFRRRTHMKQHRMLHTGEKPFACSICSRTFHLKQDLKRHVKARHTSKLLDNSKKCPQ